MANPFDSYQSAFSMFLASHKEESPPSVDSPDITIFENSQESPDPSNLSQSNNSGPTESNQSLDKTLSEQSGSMTSHLHNCASTDSISDQLGERSVKVLHPESPPPSEDANMETAQLTSVDDDALSNSAPAEESVDDTPHFQAAFEKTLNEEGTDDSLLSSELPSISLATNKVSVRLEMLPPGINGQSQSFDDKATPSDTRSAEAETELAETEDNSVAKGIDLEHLEDVPSAEQEQKEIEAEKIFEYQWPQETGGDIYMLQEHISEFLGVLSFKRKYPDLTRRPVEFDERLFLLEKGAVTETQCDLGLTALRSEEVYELMSKDYPDKYKVYIETLKERERKKVSEQNKSYASMALEKSKVDFFMKKSVQSAAEFNAQFMREKREERQSYIDLQTLEIHYPKGKNKPLPKDYTNPGAYPVALIPGQFQEYYKKYTPQELKYFPVKTALYSPHKVLKTIYADPNIVVDKDNAEEDGDKDDGSSSSDDSQSSTSGSEADSIEPETNEVKISEEQIKKLLATPRPDTPPKKRRRRMAHNGADAADSEKDSEAGSVKGSNKKQTKTPSRRLQSRTPKGRPKPSKESGLSLEGRPPLPQNLQCNICQEVGLCDKDGQYLEMAQCSECLKYAHILCLELTDEMVPIIKTYPWQCMECKTCVKCKDAQDEENMMFCDHCDRGYHTFCVGLKAIPPGRWECPSCVPETEVMEPTPKRRTKQK